MKRNVFVASLAAWLIAFCGGRALAQAAPTQVRVAIVNVGQVLHKYEKARFYKHELDETLMPYRLEGEKLKKEILDWTAAMKDPKFNPKEKDRYEQGIVDNKRKLEDLDRHATKLIVTKQEAQVITLFRDLQEAIQAYAQANGIHLVLTYAEQLEGDLFTLSNVARKMKGMDLGSTTPLFHVPGVDISGAVADAMNARYRTLGGRQAPVTPASFQKK
ncbi:MAG: OmpH family outer membrane protein [Gemmataceae bacterium]|nr:OmpH family outer membrane protein [Gemmataceae bacterium]